MFTFCGFAFARDSILGRKVDSAGHVEITETKLNTKLFKRLLKELIETEQQHLCSSIQLVACPITLEMSKEFRSNIRSMPSLLSFQLHNSPPIDTEAVVELVRAFEGRDTISFSGCKIKDRAVILFAPSINRIRTLKLSHNKIGDLAAYAIAAQLAHNPGSQLEHIDLTGNHYITKAGCAALVDALQVNFSLMSLAVDIEEAQHNIELLTNEQNRDIKRQNWLHSTKLPLLSHHPHEQLSQRVDDAISAAAVVVCDELSASSSSSSSSTENTLSLSNDRILLDLSNAREWTTSELAEWLSSLYLERYIPVFTKAKINGKFFLTMTTSDFITLGIKNKTHVNILLREQAKLLTFAGVVALTM